MGDVKEEEEPEGEAVAGPSSEAIVHSSGNTLLCFTTSHLIINYSILHLTMAYSSTIEWVSILCLFSPSYSRPNFAHG